MKFDEKEVRRVANQMRRRFNLAHKGWIKTRLDESDYYGAWIALAKWHLRGIK